MRHHGRNLIEKVIMNKQVLAVFRTVATQAENSPGRRTLKARMISPIKHRDAINDYVDQLSDYVTGEFNDWVTSTGELVSRRPEEVADLWITLQDGQIRFSIRCSSHGGVADGRMSIAHQTAELIRRQLERYVELHPADWIADVELAASALQDFKTG